MDRQMDRQTDTGLTDCNRYRHRTKSIPSLGLAGCFYT